MSESNVNAPDSGYGGGFFWGPNTSKGSGVFEGEPPVTYGTSQATPYFPTSAFGFQIVCGNAHTCSAQASFNVGLVQLSVGETTPPSISAGGLWAQTGWVRGNWPIIVGGDSPSGVCSYAASIGGDPAGTSASSAPNQTVWHQCASAGLSGALNTGLAANGADSLNVSDSDAAGLGDGASRTIQVDNVTPTVSLTGPAYASTTSGTQYVTATVNTGPSGADGATCSVNGGAGTFYPGASARIPVSGLGPQTVVCTGENNAVSASGARAVSAPASFTVDVQQPTVEAITFSHIADALRCRSVTRTVSIPGRRYVIHRHHRRIVVYSRARHVKRRIRRCQARTVRRKVLVPLRRDGRIVRRHGRIVRVARVRRVVVLPHRVQRTQRRIRHGRGTTVSGYVGLTNGTALAGQPITVFAAPDDGHPQFAPVSSATTNADGVWVAKIPAGPSRLLVAQYSGSPTTALATSTAVKLVVPAEIKLAISPRVLPWRDAITVRGRLAGGDVPPDGVALRFLVRYPHSPQRSTLLALRTDARGRFRFTWSYHGGRGVARYPFSVATTATETDYPYGAASSPRIGVTFGRPTPRVHRHPRRPRHRRHRR